MQVVNKIKFLGASGTVTGSSYQIDELLIDLGMFQGGHELNKLNLIRPEIDINKLQGVILTHAHLDHSGRLPWLVKLGYKGPIYMTAATSELAEIALLDAAKLNEEDDNYVGQVMKLVKIVEYGQKFVVGSFNCELCDAGHILGSASVLLEKNGKKIIFSGDLGNSPEDLLKPTQTFNQAEVVVMESTYGDKEHAQEKPLQVLQEEINKIENDNSTLLIPAFAIERSQEILHYIDHLKKSKPIKEDTLVFLDSPMAQKSTQVYKKYKQLYSPELYEHAQNDDPFAFPGLIETEKTHESLNIKKSLGAKVIIAGSGMMTGGRVLNHAVDVLPNPNNRLLIVGFQAMGTIGRQILDGEKVININGQAVFVKAHVRKTSGMSAHADRPKLLAWLKKISGVEKVFLTHSEDSVRKIFAQKINHLKVILPSLNAEESL
jgi:metallo-beta-lactamase family protein